MSALSGTAGEGHQTYHLSGVSIHTCGMRNHAQKAAALVALALTVLNVRIAWAETPVAPASLYEITTNTLEGKPIELKEFAGKVSLVVNVASRCGFTSQYEGLQKLHEELKDRGFSVLGFPSNNFGWQEPGTPEEIRTFCERKYNVTFPMFEKSIVKSGKDQSPVYRFLTASGESPSWNFGKYVVGRDGRVRAFFGSRTAPDSPDLRKAIEAALAEPAKQAD